MDNQTPEYGIKYYFLVFLDNDITLRCGNQFS